MLRALGNSTKRKKKEKNVILSKRLVSGTFPIPCMMIKKIHSRVELIKSKKKIMIKHTCFGVGGGEFMCSSISVICRTDEAIN